MLALDLSCRFVRFSVYSSRVVLLSSDPHMQHGYWPTCEWIRIVIDEEKISVLLLFTRVGVGLAGCPVGTWIRKARPKDYNKPHKNV